MIDAATPGGPAEAELANTPLGQPVECLGSQFVYGEGFEPVGAVPRPYGKLDFRPVWVASTTAGKGSFSTITI